MTCPETANEYCRQTAARNSQILNALAMLTKKAPASGTTWNATRRNRPQTAPLEQAGGRSAHCGLHTIAGLCYRLNLSALGRMIAISRDLRQSW